MATTDANGLVLLEDTDNITPFQTTINTITNSVSAKFDAVEASSGLPVGAVSMFAGTNAPADYMLCQGQEISRSTYAALFSIIGVTYGSGNGNTTFNLPNFSGRAPFGPGSSGINSIGVTGGEAAHTLTPAEMPRHAHTTGAYPSSTEVTGYGLTTGSIGFTNRAMVSTPSPDGVTGATGDGQPHNNMPPYLGINFIIKVK